MSALEPRIVYGAFTRFGKPIPPGFSNSVYVGYSVSPLPEGLACSVLHDPDDYRLTDKLEEVKQRIFDEQVADRFDALAHPFEALLGQNIHDCYIYSEEVYFYLKSGLGITFSFANSHDQFVPGMHSREEIRRKFNYVDNPVVDVDFDTITLADGFKFGLASRYTERQKPRVNLSFAEKAKLMRSLDMYLAERDSAPIN